MKTQIFASVIALMLLSFCAQSQSYRNDWNRDRNQRERINDGWRSGELTAREYRHLNMEQGRIHRTERRMDRDGRIGPCERQRLDAMRNHCSRDIWRDKHNYDRRF